MSYHIYLFKDKSEESVCQVLSHQEGTCYALGGSTDADMGVTYNYSRHYYRLFPDEKGFRWLDGKTAQEAIPILVSVISQLGNDVSEDYWEPTEGNAKHALITLLSWAAQNPDGVFIVSC